MKIIVGRTAGFCYGVERAVKGAIQEAKKSKKPIFCLGEIVHNRQAIENLENLGVNCIETLGEVKGKVLIRTHGIAKEVYDLAEEKQITIQDYTCPNVLKIHKIAEEFNKKGYFIFLLGSKKHPENIGTISYCGEDSYIIENESEVIKALQVFEKTKKNKLALLSQTTYSLEKFEIIKEKIKNEIKPEINFVVKNTICHATELRQKETKQLAKQVNTMIIIGGKNSSNTRKLYEIAQKECNNTFCIETSKELKENKIIGKVGIMAGASTPKESIEDVINFLKQQ